MPTQAGPVDGGFTATILPANDDDSTGFITLPFAANFFGTTYGDLYVNNNGNVTFGNSTYEFTPQGLGPDYTGLPIIAAFFSDVDTEGELSGVVTYGTGTYAGHVAFGVEFPHVGYYSSGDDRLNTFEIILTDRSDTGIGNFDVYFNYNSIQWESGEADGGVDGLAGAEGIAASAGFSNGNANDYHYYQLPGSLTAGAFLDGGPNALASNTNDGVPGQYLFQVRGGSVIGVTEGPPPPDPNPVSFNATLETHYEGDSGVTPFLATIIRTGQDLSEASTVDWRIIVADPNDLAPGQALSGQVTFAPNQTVATVEIGVAGDTIYEPSEFLQINLTHATYGDLSWDTSVTGTGIIINDDARTSFVFAGPAIRPEGQFGSTPFDFMVIRGGDVSHASSVHWTLTNGTTDALDFAAEQPLSGIVSFGAGETQAVIEIQVAGDRIVELDETFFVNLTSATNQTEGGPTVSSLHATTMATILDDDSRQTVLVGSPTILVEPEGDSGLTAFNFTVMRVGDITAAADIGYTITLPAAGGASASDLATSLTGVVSFAVGSWQTVLTVQVHGNVIPEPDKTFEVTLGGGAYNTLTLSGVIMNDDEVTASSPSGSAALLAASAADSSAFMQQLAGGGLWPAGDLL